MMMMNILLINELLVATTIRIQALLENTSLWNAGPPRSPF